MFVKNRLNIKSPGFLDILEKERRLRELVYRAEKGTRYWNSLWDQLDGILAAKAKYEMKVEESRLKKGGFYGNNIC